MKFNSAPTLDIPFSRKVLEHLIAFPEEHEQDYYGVKNACGTKTCIAGTAVMLDAATTITWDSGGGMDTEVVVDGRYIEIESRAQDLLGLGDNDATELFHNYDNASAVTQLGSYIEQAEAEQAKQ